MFLITASDASRQEGRGGSELSSPARPVQSPPAQRRRVEDMSSPIALAPTSPHEGDRSLFSSPPPPRVGTSEIDLSSPLNYGTPSSRIGGTPRGSVYPLTRSQEP